MIRFFLRRFLLIPLALVLVNFLGFAFAHVTFQFQQAQTIFGSGSDGIKPVWPTYAAYAGGVLHGDFGRLPVGAAAGSDTPTGIEGSVAFSVARAALASLGLLALAFGLSMALGLALGLAAVRVDPPRKQAWLAVISTLGLATPGFYAGILLVGGLIFFTRADTAPLLPVAGYGWDTHLVLPLLALTFRPAMQVAQVTASLLSGELSKQYVMAARSFGHTWRAIRWDKALRNILAPVLITMAGSFRLLVTDLVLIEWLFGWPGMGRMLARTLVPPRLSSLGGLADTSAFFLNPPLVAALLVVFALLFLLADLVASGLARAVDPRLRGEEAEVFHG